MEDSLVKKDSLVRPDSLVKKELIATTDSLTVIDSVAWRASLDIEQIAFEYFISRLDSVVAAREKLFNRAKDRIYFSGATSLFNDLKLDDFKTYAFKKKHFIETGSFTERNYLLQCKPNAKKVSVKHKFIVKGGKEVFNAKRKSGDLFVSMSNSYPYKGFYYVRLRLETGISMEQLWFYAKFSEDGEPLDWVMIHDIL